MFSDTIPTDLILQAYSQGYFPMAENKQDKEIQWILPSVRGVLPIEEIHISNSLIKTLKKKPFFVTVNTCFETVIKSCAQIKIETDNAQRNETWINELILNTYLKLHAEGHAHSLEVWDKESSELIGGLYGLSLGSAFFGESMFSRRSNASKIGLIYLCARLSKGNYTLLDAQFPNDHLTQFGCKEIPHEEYIEILDTALKAQGDFYCGGSLTDSTSSEFSESLLDEFLQSKTHKS